MSAGLLTARADLVAEIAELEQQTVALATDHPCAPAAVHRGLYVELIDVAGALAECCQMLGEPAAADAARQQAETYLTCWSLYASFEAAEAALAARSGTEHGTTSDDASRDVPGGGGA